MCWFVARLETSRTSTTIAGNVRGIPFTNIVNRTLSSPRTDFFHRSSWLGNAKYHVDLQDQLNWRKDHYYRRNVSCHVGERKRTSSHRISLMKVPSTCSRGCSIMVTSRRSTGRESWQLIGPTGAGAVHAGAAVWGASGRRARDARSELKTGRRSRPKRGRWRRLLVTRQLARAALGARCLRCSRMPVASCGASRSARPDGRHVGAGRMRQVERRERGSWTLWRRPSARRRACIFTGSRRSSAADGVMPGPLRTRTVSHPAAAWPPSPTSRSTGSSSSSVRSCGYAQCFSGTDSWSWTGISTTSSWTRGGIGLDVPRRLLAVGLSAW